MVKAYLRYEYSGAFGVICSGANPVYDATGKLLFTSSLENVSVWNIKQGILIKSLEPGGTNGSAAEVTILALAPHGQKLAVGYSDGIVRLWDYQSGECTITLKGHKSAVTALRFNSSGALLVSGSKDTDIILWDVAGEAGLFRLRGHKDQVTDVAFVTRANKLVSCSKDGLVKVWDLDTQHCSQTLTGHKAEVWSLDVDPAERRLVTGSTDQELRMYAITTASSDAEGAADDDHAPTPSTSTSDAGAHDLLRPMGSMRRQGQDRVVLLRFDEIGTLLGCQGTGKTVELFRMRSEEESQRKLKRRKKRRREKLQKKSQAQQHNSDEEGDHPDGPATNGAADAKELKASDELEALQTVACKSKLRSFAFAPASLRLKKGCMCQLALALSNNAIEIVDVSSEAHEVSQRVDLGGHRSDIRTLALSSDDSLLATASNNAVKVWNPRTGACIATMDSGYSLCSIFAPGNRHVVLGTKEGTLEVFDLGAATRVHVEEAHTGPVWSLMPLPDCTGFVSGSADKTVKFWQWSVAMSPEGGGKQLRLAHTRTLKMADDVLSVRISPDGRLIAVALLDATIKVFFLDSFKFFLSLYGHKLPVLCMDISSDSTLLVSGSADKNIKVWGLDFGDCHKSIFAHQDAVMQCAFVHNTHYCFSVGKDRLLKYWDLDRHEMLLELPGHHAEVWALAVSAYGDFVVTGSHDRSIRRWERTNEPFFVEEEKEKRLESLFEADLEQDKDNSHGRAGGPEGDAAGAVAPAGRRTLESVSAADSIIDALDMAANEMERLREHEADKAKNPTTVKPLAPNLLMMGLTPAAYVLRAVSGVKAADLESALLMLPFADALRLLMYLPQWLEGAQAELTCRVAVLLLRLHHHQLIATASARPVLVRLHRQLRGSMQGLKDTLGFNLAALQHLQRAVREQHGVSEMDTLLPAKRMLIKT